jgi:hypothetical protein
MDAIGKLIMKHKPHFLCLQEVTQPLMNILHTQDWAKVYHCSPPPLTPIFTMLYSIWKPSEWLRTPFDGEAGESGSGYWW